MKTAMLLAALALAALVASSSASFSGIEEQNIMNSEAVEAQMVTLSIGNRKIHLLTAPWDHCVPKGNPCGALDWCCGTLRCKGPLPYQEYISGTCQ